MEGGKFILLKTLCTSNTGPRVLCGRAELNASSQELAFMVPEGTTQASKGGKPPTVLPCYDIYEIQWPTWHDNPKDIVVAHIPWH